MNKSEFITRLEKNLSAISEACQEIENCEINRTYLNSNAKKKLILASVTCRSVTVPESNIYVATALFRTYEDHYVQELKEACLDILAAIEEEEKREAEEDEEIMKGEQIDELDL